MLGVLMIFILAFIIFRVFQNITTNIYDFINPPPSKSYFKKEGNWRAVTRPAKANQYLSRQAEAPSWQRS